MMHVVLRINFLNHILQKQKRLFAVDEFSSKHSSIPPNVWQSFLRGFVFLSI